MTEIKLSLFIGKSKEHRKGGKGNKQTKKERLSMVSFCPQSKKLHYDQRDMKGQVEVCGQLISPTV